jgi:hypothetical protein
MGELVVRRRSIYPHLTEFAKCIAALVIAASASRFDSIRRSPRA